MNPSTRKALQGLLSGEGTSCILINFMWWFLCHFLLGKFESGIYLKSIWPVSVDICE